MENVTKLNFTLAPLPLTRRPGADSNPVPDGRGLAVKQALTFAFPENLVNLI